MALSIPGCGQVVTQTLTLRVGITATVSGQSFSNETVIMHQVRHTVGGGVSSSYRHHAPYVSLGNRQILFLPQMGGNQPEVGFMYLMYMAYGVTGNIERLADDEKAIVGSNRVFTVDLEEAARQAVKPKYPAKASFIHFSDRLDKSSARWKTIKQLDDDFGIEIKAITFEAVQLPLTNVIKQLLPWIDLSRDDPLSHDALAQKNDPDASGRPYRHTVYTYNLRGGL
jgi:hypothetical protein